MVTLPTVEVPGLAAAVRRERTVRDRAFLNGNETVAGVVVKPLSLRTVLYLEHAQNGFTIPFRFDDDNEVLAHAVQVLYFSTPGWKPPEVEKDGMLAAFVGGIRAGLFRRKALSGASPELVINEVREWVSEAFMDCAQGGDDEIPAPSYASYPAHLVDLFGAAGLMFTYDEIMDMPLKRLWQHWRLAARRVFDLKLVNASDTLKVSYLSGGVQ